MAWLVHLGGDEREQSQSRQQGRHLNLLAPRREAETGVHVAFAIPLGQVVGAAREKTGTLKYSPPRQVGRCRFLAPRLPIRENIEGLVLSVTGARGVREDGTDLCHDAIMAVKQMGRRRNQAGGRQGNQIVQGLPSFDIVPEYMH